MRYIFSILIVSSLAGVFLFSCNKDDENVPDNSYDSGMVTVVSRVIRDSGLNFPQASSSSNRDANRPSGFEWPAEDYVTVDDSDSEIITVKIWLGPDNHIIPTPEWQAAHPNYCMDQGKYMRPVRKLLQFKIFNVPRDDIRAVQLNHIDVETSRIEHSVMTDWYDAAPDWMYQAMSEVWSEMRNQTTIKDAIEPCEDRIPLTLYFSSIVTNELTDASTYEEFEFSIPLQFDESKGAFSGVGDFVWVDGWIWHEDIGYQPFPAIKTGQMEIVGLITPELAGNSIENATMNFKVPIIDQENSSMLLASFMHFYTMVSNDGSNMEYRIDNWQLLDDPDIIMGTYTNNVAEFDDGTLTETTTIEIGR